MIIKNRTTEENRKFWDHVEKIAANVRNMNKKMKSYTLQATVVFDLDAATEDEALDEAREMLPYGLVIGIDVTDAREIGEAEA